MANPRQRRKARSAKHTPVSHSRRAKRLLKKQPAIRGPKIIQDAWDSKKTVRQNYAALGLASSLNPRVSGGVERADDPTGADTERTLTVRNTDLSEDRPLAGLSVPKGYGRIIRDSNGGIMSVQINDEEEDHGAEPTEDVLIEDRTYEMSLEAVEWISGGRRDSHGGGRRADVLEALEASTMSSHPVPRFSSKNEVAYLERLISKHGKDVDAMSRDRKLNPEQRTAGELRRAIRKAGGLAEFGSG